MECHRSDGRAADTEPVGNWPGCERPDERPEVPDREDQSDLGWA